VIRLPRSKLVELQHLIKSWESQRSCTRRDLESLVGKLAHASQVVQPGKTFMRRMFELLAGTRLAHHHICLSKAFRSDLQWWATFLEVWNGVTMMQCGSQCSGQASHYVWTDASGHFGCGAWWPSTGSWLQLQWQQAHTKEWEALREESILLKELLLVVLACSVWGLSWWNSAVTFHCDNMDQGRLKHQFETSARFSDLRVGIRELSFPFMQEPTEKQPLQVNQCSLSTVPSPYMRQ